MNPASAHRRPVLRALLTCALGITLGIASSATGSASSATGTPVSLKLCRGNFTVWQWTPAAAPRAIILFGSGDGGWTGWEEKTTATLTASGIIVIGLDLRAYAKTDYDPATLGADYAAIAADAIQRNSAKNLPILYGGWSMGAVQAIAAAAFPQRPATLSGLLLVSAGSRGRYGLRVTDEIGLEPTGKNTFALADLTPAITPLRTAQFQAGSDTMSNATWIKTYPGPHKLYTIADANHGFGGPDDTFTGILPSAVDWLLSSKQ